jgi:purine catabolism regulator
MPVKLDSLTVTIAEALCLPDLQRGLPEVLACPEELERPIRWVHASEVPNIASLLTGGELLLTTGMQLAAGASARREYVAGLAACGLAALVIELGSALDSVPADVCDAATEAGLPLIALHREVQFVKVTEAIHTELINRRYGLLQEGEEIKQRLVEVMLAGEGVSEVLRTFSAIVGNPVFLEGADGALLFHAGSADDLDAWERLGKPATGVRLERPVPMGRANSSGRLVILATIKALSERDHVALGQATSIVSIALLRAREEEQLVVRERGSLLADLASGTLRGADASRQAQRLGFPVGNRSLMAFAFTEIPESPPPSRAALLADLQRALDGHGLSALVGGRARSESLALVAVPGQRDRLDVAQDVAAVLRGTWEKRHPEARVIIAVDGPRAWGHAGDALSMAAETLACAVALPEADWHDATKLELERLLWELRLEGRLGEFVRRTLGPLLDHDRDRKLKLLPTLEVLCLNGGRKAEAARVLHLHRQALYHRISRIETLLGVSLSDPGRLLTLHVALRARCYVN